MNKIGTSYRKIRIIKGKICANWVKVLYKKWKIEQVFVFYLLLVLHKNLRISQKIWWTRIKYVQFDRIVF